MQNALPLHLIAFFHTLPCKTHLESSVKAQFQFYRCIYFLLYPQP